MTTRVWVAWSSGKDSALARLLDDPGVEVVGLLTTTDLHREAVPLHHVPIGLVRDQAASLGLPLQEVALVADDEAQQAAAMSSALKAAEAAGIDAVAFGDIYLEWIREHRERQMVASPLEPLFPLWGNHSADLANEVLRRGIGALITCIDAEALASTHLGQRYDETFLAGLPEGVDPCGERGEFHTFVTDHPNFRTPIRTSRAGVQPDGRYPSLRLNAVTES